jgi:hypothetical protein
MSNAALYPAFHVGTVKSACHSIPACDCTACTSRAAHDRFMPCACLHSHLTCVLTGDLLIYVGWWRNSFNGGTWLGPRVIMGMAWSGIDRNLGLQARVIPACCTGGPHCNEYTTNLQSAWAHKKVDSEACDQLFFFHPSIPIHQQRVVVSRVTPSFKVVVSAL